VLVTLLGTGSPLPDPNRAGPATLVRAGEATVLVDAGRGVLMRLAAAGSASPQLTAVLLTHLHSDHLTDLNDVITTRWVTSPVALPPLRIFGPPGTARVVAAISEMLALDVSYRLAHHEDLTAPPEVEVTEVEPGQSFELGSVAVRVAATDHRPVEPTVAYRLDHDGTSVVLGGDGVPCPGLDELCAGADAYVQTVIRDDLVRLVPFARFTDILDYHSSVADAARTAARAGVRHLVMTHYVPAPTPDQYPEWIALAAEHFDGEVVMADDGHTLTLP
jgi:ribonuclease Z